MALQNFKVQQGLSLEDGNITIVDSNANVYANALIANTITSNTNANINLFPNGTGVIDAGNVLISNVASPLVTSDAATKGYVDGVAQGLTIKDSVQAATTGMNILLDGSVTTLDGVSLQSGYRVLVKDQSDETQNGIYIVPSSGAWTRANDMNTATQVYGAFTFVEGGTKNASTGWVTTNTPATPVTLGTSSILFTQFSGAGATATNVSAGVGDLKITGGTTNYVLAASDNLGNLTYANLANYFSVTTNISTVVAGSTLQFVANFANPSYPGGVYVLEQLGPVSLTVTDAWSQSGSNIGTSKNSYANYVAGTVNSANVTITITLANANFNIQSSDSIVIGSTTLTGTQILAIDTNINGNSTATFTIPSTSLNANVEANALSNVSNPVSVSLTNNRGATGAGVNTASGTTLLDVAPIPFNVTSLSGTYSTNPIAFFSPNQSMSWSVATTTGATSITAGNLSYANTSHSISGSLTSNGSTSGSISVNSTYTYTLSTSDYAGTGATGAGARTIPSTVTGTVNPVNQYYPLFWQVTSSNIASTVINATAWSYGSNTASSAHYGSNLVTGAGTTGQYGVTTATSGDYLWIATPGATTHTFHFIAANQDIPLPPDVGPLTGTLGNGSYTNTYTIYGFTKATSVTNVYVSA